MDSDKDVEKNGNARKCAKKQTRRERKARFYGLVWNINKPTIDELSSEGIT